MNTAVKITKSDAADAIIGTTILLSLVFLQRFMPQELKLSPVLSPSKLISGHKC